MERFKLNEDDKIKPGFSPTDAYFDGFTERLMTKLPVKEAKVIPLYRKASVWISSVAAVLILALGLSLYFRSDSQNVQPDAASIETYIAYQSNISSYEIIQHLDQQDIDDLGESLSLQDINNDAIEQYLQDQNINVYE